MKISKTYMFLDKATKVFEIVLAFSLLIVIAVKAIEFCFGLVAPPIIIINMGFDSILSAAISLVIGVEFTKMLYKHTPETAIDVLLFAIARQMVIYHENSIDMLIGVVAIVGLFMAKRFLVGKEHDGNEPRLYFLKKEKYEKADND